MRNENLIRTGPRSMEIIQESLSICFPQQLSEFLANYLFNFNCFIAASSGLSMNEATATIIFSLNQFWDEGGAFLDKPRGWILCNQ